jgi:hypothetical protein
MYSRKASAVDLVIPEDIPRATYWAPGRHEPSVCLSRVEFTSPIDLPTATSKDIKGPSPVITITKYIATLGYADQYFAELEDHTKLVLGLIDLSLFTAKGEPSCEHAELYVAAQVHIHRLAAHIPGVAKLGSVFAKDSLYCLVYDNMDRKIVRKEQLDRTLQ